MSVQIQPSQSSRIRALKQTQPLLTPRDIADLTGYRLPAVRKALATVPRRRIKSVAR